MILVGLTGGIGSGKSTVSSMLRNFGAVVIDADAIVHELQQPGQPLLAELADAFGAEILDAEGRLDRASLASRAFADATRIHAKVSAARSWSTSPRTLRWNAWSNSAA
jgi:dephospho-CoA kinase